jgi:hypothetical protein
MAAYSVGLVFQQYNAEVNRYSFWYDDPPGSYTAVNGVGSATSMVVSAHGREHVWGGGTPVYGCDNGTFSIADLVEYKYASIYLCVSDYLQSGQITLTFRNSSILSNISQYMPVGWTITTDGVSVVTIVYDGNIIASRDYVVRLFITTDTAFPTNGDIFVMWSNLNTLYVQGVLVLEDSPGYSIHYLELLQPSPAHTITVSGASAYAYSNATSAPQAFSIIGLTLAIDSSIRPENA